MTKLYTSEEHAAWLESLPKKTVSVKVVMKSKQGRVLILKPNYKNTWQLPGGAVDANESPEEAAIREVKEETDITIAKEGMSLVDVIYWRDRDGLIFMYEVKGLLDESVPIVFQQEEIEGYEYLLLTELSSRLPAYYKDFLDKMV